MENDIHVVLEKRYWCSWKSVFREIFLCLSLCFWLTLFLYKISIKGATWNNNKVPIWRTAPACFVPAANLCCRYCSALWSMRFATPGMIRKLSIISLVTYQNQLFGWTNWPTCIFPETCQSEQNLINIEVNRTQDSNCISYSNWTSRTTFRFAKYSKFWSARYMLC